jgi:hypothetical protein
MRIRIRHLVRAIHNRSRSRSRHWLHPIILTPPPLRSSHFMTMYIRYIGSVHFCSFPDLSTVYFAKAPVVFFLSLTSICNTVYYALFT